MASARTHYDNLKVARNAPQSVIRAAYKALSQQYHPDKNPGDDRAARVMQIINRSYEVLSDPQARADHDMWIQEQESSGTTPPPPHQRQRTQPNSAPVAGIRVPPTGSNLFEELSPSGKATLLHRVRGNADNQSRILLGNSNLAKGVLLVAAAYLAYVVYSGFQFRWPRDTVEFHRVATSVAGAIAAYGSYVIWMWYRNPLRPVLLVTPLYLIETDYLRVRYWPLTEFKDPKVTHHYKNGVYTGTSILVNLNGKYRKLWISTQAEFTQFADAVSRYGALLNDAARVGDQAYVDRFDDFSNERSTSAKAPFAFLKPSFLAFVGGAILYTLFAALLPYNQNLLYREHGAYSATPPTPANSAKCSAGPALPRKDYIADAIGSTPARVGYIESEMRLDAGGLSTVTVDNSRNDADVLVKLVSLQRVPAYPIRVFFIPAGGQFKVEDISPGRYDVRYLERWSGAMAKSDPFVLSETERHDGTEYSQLTLTLYKVANGNMRTHRINESEF